MRIVRLRLAAAGALAALSAVILERAVLRITPDGLADFESWSALLRPDLSAPPEVEHFTPVIGQ